MRAFWGIYKVSSLFYMNNKEVTFSEFDNEDTNYLFPNSESQTELIFLLEKKLICLGVLEKSEFRRDLTQIIKDLDSKINNI